MKPDEWLTRARSLLSPAVSYTLDFDMAVVRPYHTSFGLGRSVPPLSFQAY